MFEIAQESNLAQIVNAAIEKHGTGADAFIPIMLEINHEYGYIPGEAIRLMRHTLHDAPEAQRVSEGQLYGLASFYQMLHTHKKARHLVQYCQSAPCHVQGGRELRKAIQQTLNLQPGQSDPQARFTLETVNCLGLCGVGPLLMVDEDLYGNVTASQLDDIFAKYK